jgi:Uma2 family endonuclease
MVRVATQEPSLGGGKRLPGQDELPCEDGEPMETGFHDAQAALLKDTLMDAWAERRDFFVGGNMFVYFSERQIRANDFRGPDVFVVLDTEAKGRKSWVAWEEGGKLPDVVIELTSQSTAHVDYGEKKRIYAQIWRTSAYFIFDPDKEELLGFRLDPDRREYFPIEPDASGDLAVPALGLKLGLRPTDFRHHERRFVRWIDARGRVLPLGRERADEERARADEERERAERAESRRRELEEKLGSAKPSDDP